MTTRTTPRASTGVRSLPHPDGPPAATYTTRKAEPAAHTPKPLLPPDADAPIMWLLDCVRAHVRR